MNAVTITHLSKTYPNGTAALQDITLALRPGEVCGFLGPNGAGKTTTVKLLNGILTPSGGSLSVLGMDPAREPEKIHARCGVVTEHAQMYDNLTGKENLLFYASVFGISPSEAADRADALLWELDLLNAQDKKLSSYSTGMRQRLSLARALIHRPDVLFLDEPTSGLDPESARNVNLMIRRLAEESGVTVFLCTHQLRYAQEICSRYCLIEKGKLLADGTLKELRSRILPDTVLRIRAGHMPVIAGQYDPGQHSRENIFQEISPGHYETHIRSEEEIPAIVRQIAEKGGLIYSVENIQPSLEDIYFALTDIQKEASL